jgi:hypothetical protein
VSFAAITLCIASQRVFIIVVYFVIDSVRKLLVTPSYVLSAVLKHGHTEMKFEHVHSSNAISELRGGVLLPVSGSNTDTNIANRALQLSG